MKAVLDACVLVPTVLREVLIAVAAAGAYRPLWSERILEEWARVAARRGPRDEVEARGEIALVKARFPVALVPAAPAVEARLWLPDANDIHVLATAIAGRADLIVTFNAKDFPRGALDDAGLERMDPDQFLAALRRQDGDRLDTAVRAVHAAAERIAGGPVPIRTLLKRAGLPKLGKALQDG